jgi:hypothetical protein
MGICSFFPVFLACYAVEEHSLILVAVKFDICYKTGDSLSGAQITIATRTKASKAWENHRALAIAGLSCKPDKHREHVSGVLWPL